MQVRNHKSSVLSMYGARVPKDKYSIPNLSFKDSSININNNFKYSKKPLKQYSKELSFKGFSLSKIKVDNYQDVLSRVTSVIGDSFNQKFTQVLNDNPSRIIINGNSIEFSRKSILRMLGESLAYPFVKMPFDLLDFSLNVLKKVPGVKKIASTIYDSEFLTKKRQATINEETYNSMMGMFDQVSKKLGKSNDSDINDWIFNLSQKNFDPNLGKYNTVHERALNRIVSGIVPAFFLANDAYNLSRYCDDDKKQADKEHKTRFNQEVSRVGITAYIQLVTLGALTKFVNSSLIGTALSSTIPVLIAETSSRLANGKSITFISKNKAKEMAKENGIINIDANQKENVEQPIYKYYSMPVSFSKKDNKTFMAFKGKMTAFNAFEQATQKQVIDRTALLVGKASSDRDKTNKNNKEGKGLLTVGMIKNAMLASIAIGFGLKFARKNKTIDTAFNKFFGYFKENYNKLVKKDYVINKTEFNSLITKLRNGGFDKIADKYTTIMNTQDADLAKLTTLLKDLLANINNEKYNSLLAENKDFLKQNKINTLTLKRNINGILNSLENRSDDVYTLSKIDKKIKPWVDFVIAPFKFIWATAKFPYTIVNNIVNLIHPTSVKKATTNQVDVLTKSLSDIADKAKKMSDEDFVKYLKDNMLSSFNNTTKSDYSNAELGKITKLFASTVTTWFLIADDYNMVMMKSLGEDEAGASLKAKERFQQRITGIFYQTLFIDLFNNTFKKFYNTSLLAMTAVTGSCSLVCEYFTRKSIGKPVGKMSRDEINNLEYENNNAKGLKGKYFRFMTELTGKKAVSADALKKKSKNA